MGDLVKDTRAGGGAGDKHTVGVARDGEPISRTHGLGQCVYLFACPQDNPGKGRLRTFGRKMLWHRDGLEGALAAFQQ